MAKKKDNIENPQNDIENKENAAAEETQAEAAEAAAAEEAVDESAAQIAKLNEEIATLKDTHLRLLAEYDNFKRRTAREKEALLFDATLICMNKFLPVLDNLLRAQAAPCSDDAYKSGVDMVFKSFMEALERMGVKKIEALDAPFDPKFHNAVMHVEGEEYPENTVVEVFQDGYIMGERVIRPSMVKVAN